MGGSAAVMAGPLGRRVQAETDAYMKAEILGYSRSRGVFAGISLDGSTFREDAEDNKALYGKSMTNMQILQEPGAKTPMAARPLVAQLNSVSTWEKK
jgi:lipid-binding SYLF domain-containing protein